MRKFIDENFLLYTPISIRLYHDFAKDLPIMDYHCHLPADQIAHNLNFKNLTQAWLYGDHYKWRAMRTSGVEERFITGEASDLEKFNQWARTVPYTLRNPLYHWTHLELQRYFGITEILNEKTGGPIYEKCSEMLQSPEYSVQNLMKNNKVKLVCTTDDPADSLEFHKMIRESSFEIKVLPSFRPDKALQIENLPLFNSYVDRLESLTNISISNYSNFLDSLKLRHDYFEANGCCISDHGLEQLYSEAFSELEVASIFKKARENKTITIEEEGKFKSALLVQLATWNFEKGWVQQYHLGALRNGNTRMMKKMGPDSGWDSIGDFTQAQTLGKFLNRLDSQNQLAKTIIYNLNPSQNEVVASMIGNFNDGTFPGKIQYGAAWWFLDQKDGIVKQLNALSNMGLLSKFIGMLTDSRSFLSFPRHEYFRRILCNLLGEEIENGELPADIIWTGKIIQDICYNNACRYFKWE
ncbi:MAG: glucuronate isomerase [Flavisolibacter sp.]